MTIREIVLKCGVSPVTMNRVAIGRDNVQPENEARILAALDEAGYTKNIAARVLASQRFNGNWSGHVQRGQLPLCGSTGGHPPDGGRVLDLGVSMVMKCGVIRAMVCHQPFQKGYQVVRVAGYIILSGAPVSERITMENQLGILENL